MGDHAGANCLGPRIHTENGQHAYLHSVLFSTNSESRFTSGLVHVLCCAGAPDTVEALSVSFGKCHHMTSQLLLRLITWPWWIVSSIAGAAQSIWTSTAGCESLAS